MDELSTLKSLGFEMPSPAYLFGAVVFGIVGLVAWRYGRKRGRKYMPWIGVALMFYPYVVSSTPLLYVVGFALCAGIFLDKG